MLFLHPAEDVIPVLDPMDSLGLCRRPRDSATVLVQLHERPLEELDEPNSIHDERFGRTFGTQAAEQRVNIREWV